MFAFYYGDYEGIIANFVLPRYSFDLIFRGVEKCFRYNNTKEAFAIMRYLEPYFMGDFTRCNTDYFYRFINSNIICNYYQNVGRLLDNVITMINAKLDSGDDAMRNLISRNANNLGFYSNRNELHI
jgi:hypothetical protein